MSVSAPRRSEILAGNRAFGRIGLSLATLAGTSRRQRVHESGSLRVRFPNGDGRTLDAVLVNTAGGMTGGDRFDIAISVGARAKLSVTTAAAEKIYRTADADAEIDVKLDVAEGGTLAWLPQETIVFDRAGLRRSIEAELAPGASLLLGEAVVFGRSAMGEAVVQGSFHDRWRVRVGGTLAFAETVRLDGMIAQQLGEAAIAAGGVAAATLVKIPGGEQDVANVNAIASVFAGEVGISAWNGFAVTRLLAKDGAALRHDLTTVLPILNSAPLPRLWAN
jgi:urease accessory protein